MAKLVNKKYSNIDYTINLTKNELNYVVAILGNLTKKQEEDILKSGDAAFSDVKKAIKFMGEPSYNLFSDLADILDFRHENS